MKNKITSLLAALNQQAPLSLADYEALIVGQTEETAAEAAALARETRQRVYGNGVYLRGLIEVSSICKNDCYYCGIRKSNAAGERYRLTEDDILACCAAGFALGFRTFVLQGGEDAHFTDRLLCRLISQIKARFPDCAITLSLGERSRESYQHLFEAGADRYLLRHETANPTHYNILHPPAMTLAHRLDCLYALREIGFQVGCGFMVGSPGQTPKTLAEDLKLIERFQPEMCGIGPFIPHKDTPFRDAPAGSLSQTCYLLSLIRLICPSVLLPATTALGSIHPNGREMGLLAGANVVMPNLSPPTVRDKYKLYNNKLNTGAESAEHLALLNARIQSVGCFLADGRGDNILMGKKL